MATISLAMGMSLQTRCRRWISTDRIPEAHPADRLRLETAPRTTEIHDKDSPGQHLMATQAMATADTALDSHRDRMEPSEA